MHRVVGGVRAGRYVSGSIKSHTNMQLPFKSSENNGTPDFEEILSRLPIDEQHLNELSLQPNGHEKAAQYAAGIFETKFGDEVQIKLTQIESDKLESVRSEAELK